ncbi:MAG: urease-associated protein [Kaistia sp. SCN 65-12]|nr:MAG: urease-associated protein [Kaistia sp. SCN 65-12]
MRRTLLIVAFTLASLSAAHAAADCDNATDQATMNACADKALKASDAELNATYKKITHRLAADPDTTKLLVAAQRAWVSFRDAECTFASAGTSGGSAYPMVHAMCLDEQTRARTAALKALLDCEEGDMSCPVPAE